MLPKLHRLRTADFKNFRKSSVFHSPHLVLRVVKTENPFPRFAAVSAKSVLKKATERNLFRRRIYAVLRECHPSLVPQVSASVSAKQGISSLSFESLKKELHSLLVTSKLLKPSSK